MGFIRISKILLVLELPFLIFLLVLNFLAFNDSFYKEKFLEYGVQKDIPSAVYLHENVMSFLKGTSNELPPDFNGREKQHLQDVKKVISISTTMLYTLIVLFMFLLVVSAFMLKNNKHILKFISSVLLLGGLLTLILSASLLFFVSYNFSAAFESFHNIFFQKGTYAFDAEKEIIVRLYPEQLFMDLGIYISKWVVMGAGISILLGSLLIMKSKKNK